MLYRTVEEMELAQKDRLTGVFCDRYGTPTTFALEEAVAALEGGGRALAHPSGLAAISATLMSLLKAGDHLLMVDSVYGPALDIVIHAATKYIVGNSDVMLGVIVVRDPEICRAIKLAARGMGYCAAPDDCYLALRGLRTLGVRLRQHGESGLALTRWLRGPPEVARAASGIVGGSRPHAVAARFRRRPRPLRLRPETLCSHRGGGHGRGRSPVRHGRQLGRL